MIRAFIEDYRLLRSKHPRHVSCLKWIMTLSLLLNMVGIGSLVYQKRQAMRAVVVNPSIVKETALQAEEKIAHTAQEAKEAVKTEMSVNEQDNTPPADLTNQRLTVMENKIAELESYIKPEKLPNTENTVEKKVEASKETANPEPAASTNKSPKFFLNVLKKQPDQS